MDGSRPAPRASASCSAPGESARRPAPTVMGLSGIATGVVNTYGISWLQRRTDPAMQGRVMSLLMLASMGLTPLGYAVSGAIAQANLTLLFVLAGGMMLLCGVGAAASR